MKKENKKSFVDRHIIALVIPVTLLCCYALSNPPSSETLSYTGTLQNMAYDTNGFGDVFGSTLCFVDGAKFSVDGYQEFGVGFNYTISYQQFTYISGVVTNTTLSVDLAKVGSIDNCRGGV